MARRKKRDMRFDGRELEEAARLGKLEILKAAIEDGVDLTDVKAGEDSLLCHAAMSRQLAAVSLLIEAGAKAGHRGYYGRTPLHYASMHPHIEIVRRLLDSGADVNAVNDADEDPLMDAITQQGVDPAVARLLLSRGLDLEKRRKRADAKTHLMWATFCGRVEIVRVLLEAGVDPNVKKGRQGRNVFDELRGGSLDPTAVRGILHLLVAAGLDPESALDDGETVLMRACELGDLELVTMLLDRGANPNARSRFGATPLTTAAEGGNAEKITALLKERGATGRVPGVVERAGDEVALAARRRAEESRKDPDVRIEYARVLLRLGFRAAAWHELQAAEALGTPVPPEAAGDFRFEKHGETWTFASIKQAPSEVAALTEDARFPGARVSCGAKVLPLVVAMGARCNVCDENGIGECTECQGSGTRVDAWDQEYECPPRRTCVLCLGTKCGVNGFTAGKGVCRHANGATLELTGPTWTLGRCAECGLAAISHESYFRNHWACGVCALFNCACPRGG